MEGDGLLTMLSQLEDGKAFQFRSRSPITDPDASVLSGCFQTPGSVLLGIHCEAGA